MVANFIQQLVLRRGLVVGVTVADPGSGYTDEAAQDALAAAFAAGTHSHLTITYNDASNLFDFAVVTGTSGATIPLCNTANTWGAIQSFPVGVDIDSGTIDGTDIGTAVPASATFTDVVVSGNLDVSGDLNVSGDVVTFNVATVDVEDPLIKLARGNTGNLVDIGHYGVYRTGAIDLFAGLFRDATDGKYKLFHGLQVEPTTTVNTGALGYTVSTLVANLEGNVTGTLTGNATGTASALATARLIGNVSFDGTADITPKEIQVLSTTTNAAFYVAFFDAFSGNKQPRANTNFQYNPNSNTLTANVSGTATSAGTATVGNTVPITDTTDSTCWVVLVESQTGTQALKSDGGIGYDASTGTLTTNLAGDVTGNVTGDVIGNLTGNVTGNVSGSSGSCTGNAATATALQTSRNINGVAFNGTADITVTADAGTLTGTQLIATVPGAVKASLWLDWS